MGGVVALSQMACGSAFAVGDYDDYCYEPGVTCGGGGGGADDTVFWVVTIGIVVVAVVGFLALIAFYDPVESHGVSPDQGDSPREERDDPPGEEGENQRQVSIETLARNPSTCVRTGCTKERWREWSHYCFEHEAPATREEWEKRGKMRPEPSLLRPPDPPPLCKAHGCENFPRTWGHEWCEEHDSGAIPPA